MLSKLLLLTLVFALPVSAQIVTKLNPAFVEGGGIGGNRLGINNVLTSPDNQHVLYFADQETTGMIELYSVPTAGGAAVKLNGPLITGTSIDAFSVKITPDSSRVIYRAQQDTAGASELYSVPITGGTPVKLHPSLPAGVVVTEGYEITSDSTRVVFKAELDDEVEVDFTPSLFSTPVTGGTAINLTPDIGEFSFFNDVLLSPDDTTVVYTSSTNGPVELFAVPITGGTTVRLNDPFDSDGGISEARLTPDGSRVIYTADRDLNGFNELFSVPINGSANPIKLNPPFSAGANISRFFITPDSSHVVYFADQERDTFNEFFSVPVDGSTAAVKLDVNLVAEERILTFSPSPAMSPDGQHMVFGIVKNSRRSLFSVPVAGGPAVRLSTGASDGLTISPFARIFNVDGETGSSTAAGIRITPDSERVIFTAGRGRNNRIELFSTPIAGGPVIKLNAPLVGGGNVLNMEASADGTTVIYAADQDTNNIPEIYATSIIGGLVSKINSPFVPGGSTGNRAFTISPDSQRVLYLADGDTDGTVELFSAALSDGNVSIIDISFTDADQDGLPLILELALGTDPDQPSAGDAHLPSIEQSSFESTPVSSFTFGRGAEALPGTILIVEFSADLTADSFEELYRFDFDSSIGTKDPRNDLVVIERADDFSVLLPLGDQGFFRVRAE